MESIVSIVITSLNEFLQGEIRFFRGIEADVKWITDELKYMKAFLIDAETKEGGGDTRVRTWISGIRDIVYQIEDVIDAFTHKAKGDRISKMGAIKAVANKILFVSRNDDIYSVGETMKAIRQSVLDLSTRRGTYGISDIHTPQEGTSGANTSRLSNEIWNSSLADEEYFVGFHADLESLEAKLLDSNQSRIVSILGEGGSGKTTLARRLYHMNKDKFHIYAWICAKQMLDIMWLLKIIIASVKYLNREELERLEMMERNEMRKYLYGLLEESRYLLVIDDMGDENVWHNLKTALPEKKNGSKIIVTTRIPNVAEHSDIGNHIHKLRFLNSTESWDLFLKKRDGCPQELQILGKEMVEMCAGLPLAIIVLGGLLSAKHDNEWDDVKKSISQELKDKVIPVSSLLELSYKDLPRNLQLCFLYLCLFPEDFVIDAKKLIRLWVAENFIELEEGFDLEQSAEKHLKELSRRCLIQVVELKLGTISACRVHYLLRDLALAKARHLELLHIHNEATNSDSALSPRRIFIHSRHEAYTSLDKANRVRTLAFLYNKSIPDIFLNNIGMKTLMPTICKRYKLLRVLELKGAGIAMKEAKMWLSKVCETLIHLKYLGLEDTYIDELPKSISKLQALQTLYVDNSSKNKPPTILPKEICKLTKLRHLIGHLTVCRGTEKKGQTVIPPILFGKLTNLRSLRSLGIHEWQTGEGDRWEKFEAFAKPQNLKILAVRCTSAHNFSITPLLKCRNLIDLEIDGRIETLPKDMCKLLSNLRYLSLEKSGLNEDPMPTLELLPNLLVLRIAAFNVIIMTVTAKGFPELEELEFSSPRGVTTMQIEEGAMPKLKLLGMDSVSKYCFPERFKAIARK